MVETNQYMVHQIPIFGNPERPPGSRRKEGGPGRLASRRYRVRSLSRYRIPFGGYGQSLAGRCRQRDHSSAAFVGNRDGIQSGAGSGPGGIAPNSTGSGRWSRSSERASGEEGSARMHSFGTSRKEFRNPLITGEFLSVPCQRTRERVSPLIYSGAEAHREVCIRFTGCRRLHLPTRSGEGRTNPAGSKNRRMCGNPLLGPGRSAVRHGSRAGDA